MFQGDVFLPSQLWLLQLTWKNSNNNYDSVGVKMLTLAPLSCWCQAPPPLYPITLSENCFFPSLKICKCVKVGYSQPPCLLFSLCCRIRGGGGGWSRMHPSPGPWLAVGARRALRRLLASVLIEGQFRSLALEALPECVTFAPLSTPQSADSLVGIVGNGRQRGRLQGETDEISSVKRAGQMTEAWYLISEGYKLLITLPRCVIMMEDTVSLVLMDESAPLLNVLNSAIKQNNITSDFSILEG